MILDADPAHQWVCVCVSHDDDDDDDDDDGGTPARPPGQPGPAAEGLQGAGQEAGRGGEGAHPEAERRPGGQQGEPQPGAHARTHTHTHARTHTHTKNI